jgi:hypothetical protein
MDEIMDVVMVIDERWNDYVKTLIVCSMSRSELDDGHCDDNSSSRRAI